MTPDPKSDYVIFCVEDEPEVLQSLVRDVESVWGSVMRVEGFLSPVECLDRARELVRDQVSVPLVIADHLLPEMKGTEMLEILHDESGYRHTQKVILSAQTTLDDLTRPLNKGALNGNVSKPWKLEDLKEITQFLITEYFIHHAPGDINLLHGLVDVEQLSRAFVSVEQRSQTMERQLKSLQRSFISDRELPDQEVERLMIEEIDEALNHPERDQLPAGTCLLKEGEAVDGIWLILSGKVQLVREVSESEVIFHSETVGPIVGLLALTYGRPSYFTCRAVTDIKFIRVTLEQLDQALQMSPALSIHFVTVLLRSLARRNRRAVELQISFNYLNKTLEAEKNHLAETLEQLKKAQMRLVESEKMATLGQLVAGIAHELNNPVAAIDRAVDFLLKDINGLASNHPDRDLITELVVQALTVKPLSTREQRESRKGIQEVVGDENIARQLVGMGIRTSHDFEHYFSGVNEDALKRRVNQLASYYQLGSSLRNIRTCASRISTLVSSLRSFAKSDKELSNEVNLHQGIEETLLLFNHKMREVEITRDYGDLPPVEAREGELNQVWTNLVSNALQAMGNKGALSIRTGFEREKQKVWVEVIDSGPGIPKDVMHKIFDINFTTKQGRVEFGLGLGLPICREIVARHGGRIEVDSEPGRTCFQVNLPVSQDAERPEDLSNE